MGRNGSPRGKGKDRELEAGSESEESEIVLFSNVEHALQQADTPDKVKDIDDKLAAIQELFKRERRALAEQNKLAELRIRTQRQGGEILGATVRRGRPKKRSHDATFSLPEGIDKTTSSRWQTLARLPEKKLDDYLKLQEERVEEVTTTGFVRFAGSKKTEEKAGELKRRKAAFEAVTPLEIVGLVQEVLGEIDLDPCSNSRKKPNMPAKEYYLKSDNGLTKSWKGKVYMHPPSERLEAWVEKLASSYEEGDVLEAVALLPAETDTEWFRRLKNYSRCFVCGRPKLGVQGEEAPYPVMVVYLGNRLGGFEQSFKTLGDIYQSKKERETS